VTLEMLLPVGATATTVPARVRSGTASKETSTFWLGVTFAASDSSNGTTTWKVLISLRTRNWLPPGRWAPVAGLPRETLLFAAPPATPGMGAKVPGANGLVFWLGLMYSPGTPLMTDTVPATGARNTVWSTSRWAAATWA